MSGAVLIYCHGHKVLAAPLGSGWIKCSRCGEVWRTVTDTRGKT